MANKYRNVLYIGVTSDLRQRIWEHRNHKFELSFTDRYNVEFLLYYEVFDFIDDAIKREKQLKRWRRDKKDNLIKSKNPDLKDLYYDVMDGSFSLLEN